MTEETKAKKTATAEANGNAEVNGRDSKAGHVVQYTAPRFDSSAYSREHAASISLMEDFFAKIAAQEEMYVDAGFPAEGLTAFLARWWNAWERRSVEQLRDCMADDLVYADPSGGSRDWAATQVELFDLYSILFRVAPDTVFYPQDASQKALPYYDFLDGKVRLTVPWRAIGRIKGAVRPFDIVGVDRYDMERDPEYGWVIKRIDTDLDLLGAFTQLLPLVPINGMSQPFAERLVRTILRVAPSLRGPKVRPMAADQR